MHVAGWMSANRLQLNAAKTKFLWLDPPRRRHQLPPDHLVFGPVQVTPVASVRDLGVHLDTDMTMKTHVTRLVSSCFGILRQIRSIRRSLPRSTLTMLISSFIMSKLDYCNVVGLTRCDLDRLHSVINAAARLTVGAQHYDHISPLLVDFHWLRMVEHIQYKLCVLVYRCLHGQHHDTFNRQSVRWQAWNHGVVCGQARHPT